MNEKPKIAIVGLGYVGLPLAVCFAKKFDVIGFDVDAGRIRELREGEDRTQEVEKVVLKEAQVEFTTDPSILSEANVIVLTVPTPVDAHKRPDLSPLLGASATVGKHLSKDTLVVFESTVFPGATEEVCIPVLERESGLKWKTDFHVGYSPERVNPGDKAHTVDQIKKVVSGDSPATAETISKVYSEVITAGVYTAASIKTAEAAKVIENCQRDINIAFVNELALIFQKMGIDTADVLEAAATKWNFLPFKPGLVGGHCIGVDPYYLTYKAEAMGYNPQVILAGRRINDEMGVHIASRVIKLMIEKDLKIRGTKVLLLGITFKENCPDIRNSKAIDIVNELTEFGVEVVVYDPLADADEVKNEYGVDLVSEEAAMKYVGDFGAVVLAVPHREFLDEGITRFLGGEEVVYDIKSVMDRELVTERL